MALACGRCGDAGGVYALQRQPGGRAQLLVCSQAGCVSATFLLDDVGEQLVRLGKRAFALHTDSSRTVPGGRGRAGG